MIVVAAPPDLVVPPKAIAFEGSRRHDFGTLRGGATGTAPARVVLHFVARETGYLSFGNIENGLTTARAFFYDGTWKGGEPGWKDAPLGYTSKILVKKGDPYSVRFDLRRAHSGKKSVDVTIVDGVARRVSLVADVAMTHDRPGGWVEKGDPYFRRGTTRSLGLVVTLPAKYPFPVSGTIRTVFVAGPKGVTVMAPDVIGKSTADNPVPLSVTIGPDAPLGDAVLRLRTGLTDGPAAEIRIPFRIAA